jgi:long-chain acyl-CoA synthetase
MRDEEYLPESARWFPNKAAFIVEETRLTFGDLENQANRLACVLCGRGVRRGDRVVVFCDNTLEAAIGILAVLKKHPKSMPDRH